MKNKILHSMKIDFSTNLSLRVTSQLDFFPDVSQNFDKFHLLGKLITQGFPCTELESSQQLLIPAFKISFILCIL